MAWFPPVCDHEWSDATPLGSAQMISLCGKCGLTEYGPLHLRPIPLGYRSANGILMHRMIEGDGRGGPHQGTITRHITDGTKIGYGCGCVWYVDEMSIMQCRGPLSFEHQCPVHAPNPMQGLGPMRGVGPYDAAPEPPRELELTFETEPIVGWRMWRVVTHHLHGGISEPRLQPLTGRNLWEPRQRYEASCLPHASGNYGNHGDTHEAPGRNCDCGTWAVRDRRDLPDTRSHGDRGILCVGEVRLWGRVLEFNKGWRAKYAYPKSLTLLADDQAMADDLARLYGVEVVCNAPEARADESAPFAFGGYLRAATMAAVDFDAAMKKMTASMAKGIAESAKLAREMQTAKDEANAILERAKKPVPPRARPSLRDALRRR